MFMVRSSIIPFPLFESLVGRASACGPKLDNGEVCQSRDSDGGSKTFKGVDLRKGSSMVTLILLLDKVARPSCLEDLLIFLLVGESFPL